jgi:uracil-DNA glycosylase
MSIPLQDLISAIPTKWRDVILAFPGLAALVAAYREERENIGQYIRVYPPPMSVFRCFEFFDPKDLKVVILGQDPYHGPKQATGLCFAVESKTPVPPSLRNIRKELWASTQRRLASSDLVEWAQSGVLLLNAALTVREHSPASNMKIWSKFTGYIIDWINKNCKGVVFVAWGAFAHNRMMNVDMKRHRLLVSSHPSPLSASRPYRAFSSFKGSKIFNKIEELSGVKLGLTV